MPLDTTEYTKYYRNVMAKGLINRYAISYVDTHRKEIRKMYKTDDAFVKNFQVTPEMLNELKALADAEKVEFNQEQFDRSEPLFKMVIKGLIGRDIYDNATYFKVFNLHDPIFQKAYDIINSQDYTTILPSSR